MSIDYRSDEEEELDVAVHWEADSVLLLLLTMTATMERGKDFVAVLCCTP